VDSTSSPTISYRSIANPLANADPGKNGDEHTGASQNSIILTKGSILWARVNSDEIPPDIAKFRIAKTTPDGKNAFFVQIHLSENLQLIVKNRKPSLSPCLCFIPAFQQQVESVNEAYTRISRTFEPRRRSNTGNVFLLVFVEQGLSVVPLDTLRQSNDGIPANQKMD